MNTQLLDCQVEFHLRPFATPLVLSSGRIEVLTEARARVTVRVNGREATGVGSIYLSDLWAWPDDRFTHAQRDEALRSLCTYIAQNLKSLCSGEAAHPLELGLRLHHAVNHLDDAAFEAIPILARSMCLSPFDAAIHDAAGYACETSAFRFYDTPSPIPSADHWFDGDSCQAIRQLLRDEPAKTLPYWIIVGKADDLGKLLPGWVQSQCRCYKIKITGTNNEADISRTIELYRRLRELKVDDASITVDSNEANPDAASVVDFLEQLRAREPGAFASLKYLEQPTGRDITKYQYDWKKAASLKPVLLDEGLTSLEVMKLAQQQGWSGFALKTCKGHSFALVAAAWASRHGMLLSLQDLTNPGYSLIHAALFASFVPTINGVELNSPQFTPAANNEWLPRLQTLFAPSNGKHQLPATPHGLGGRL